MNLSTHIARRYILGKKSHNAINVVSFISILGVVVGTMSFIIILSVFNGFDQLVQSMYNSFNPDLMITASKGKVFSISNDTIELIKNNNGVKAVAEILEDNGLMLYDEKQTVGTIKGVSGNYNEVNMIDSLVYSGTYSLYIQGMPSAIVGRGLAYHLALNPNLTAPLKIYVPKRTARISMDPNKSLSRKYILVSGTFSSQPDIDGKYAIVPIDFARQLFGYNNEVSSLEIKLSQTVQPEKVQIELQKLLGDNLIIKNRYQQNELLYKTMRSEKWAIFAILALVLVILLFSLVGSLSMLIIEKKKDIGILNALGANARTIRSIFYKEGIIITLAGTLVGLLLGTTVIYLQETFGLIKLQGGFIIDAYPVDLQFQDLIIVISTIIIIGFVASWYPIRFLLKRTAIKSLSV